MKTNDESNPYLLLAGMHGPPEQTGLALRESLFSDPIDGWDVEIANEPAVDQGVRYVKKNLATAFPGNSSSADYEDYRPQEIVSLAKGRKVVLEVHDRPQSTGEYAVIGMAYTGDPLAIAASLGITHILYSTGNRLTDHTCTTLVVEMCRNDAGDTESKIASNVRRLRQCMGAIATGTVPAASPENFSFYTFADEVHSTRAQALGLERDETCIPFGTVPPYVIKKLGLPPGRSYIFEGWNASGSSQGEWFGEILQKFSPAKTVDLARLERPGMRAYGVSHFKKI